jgi:hypothetical protein
VLREKKMPPTPNLKTMSMAIEEVRSARVLVSAFVRAY